MTLYVNFYRINRIFLVKSVIHFNYDLKQPFRQKYLIIKVFQINIIGSLNR